MVAAEDGEDALDGFLGEGVVFAVGDLVVFSGCFADFGDEGAPVLVGDAGACLVLEFWDVFCAYPVYWWVLAEFYVGFYVVAGDVF